MSSPEEFSAYLKSETEKWARVVKESGIQQE
jgi:tripartite-type tricarboxylate transporter receptor subunit TctC